MKIFPLSLLILSEGLYRTQAQAVCPIIEKSYSNTRLDADDPNGPDFREVSGIAFSPTQRGPSGKPIFFAASDGGGGARIGIFDSEDGKRLKTVKIDRSIFRNNDWESLTIGSCGSTGADQTCLYVMDSGDNKARVSNGGSTGRGSRPYQLLKIKEPRLKDYKDDGLIPQRDCSVLKYDYRHSSSPTRYADCESMFLDHTGWGENESKGDIYLATKWDSGNQRKKNRLFHIPAKVWPSTMNGSETNYSPRAVGKYDYNDYEDLRGSHFMQTTWSSAEMSFDGTLIAIANLQKSYVFLRCPGTSVADAMVNPDAGSKACVSWNHPASGQVESFAWMPDKDYALNIPEGDNPRMGWTKMAYDRTRSSNVCPGGSPTRRPTPPLTNSPSRSPTPYPTPYPSPAPTKLPTPAPTKLPTPKPSMNPTVSRSQSPSQYPTESPSFEPSDNPTQAPTPCNGHSFQLKLQTDHVGAETSWFLRDGNNQVVAQGGNYPNNALTEVSVCLDNSIHTFIMLDSHGDGLCCRYGRGWYQVYYDGTLLVDSDGDFGSQQVTAIAPGVEEPRGEEPTDRPINDRTVDIFPMFCPGVCGYDERLVNPSEVAIFSRGSGDVCGALDAKYKQLYMTQDACDALSASAQSAGCDCADDIAVIANDEPRSTVFLAENVTASEPKDFSESSDLPSVEDQTLFGLGLGIAIIGVALAILLVRAKLLRSFSDDESLGKATVVESAAIQEENELIAATASTQEV